MTHVQKFITENEFGVGEVRSWASLLDDNCRLQAESISRVSIVEDYLALMPDAHHGFGPPVGSALITKNAIMPYAVGVDIGCGMIAGKTNLKRSQFEGKEGLVLQRIRNYIPSGVPNRGKRGETGRHDEPNQAYYAFELAYGPLPNVELIKYPEVAAVQYGTLGSGNHFVEVCTDNEDTVWFVLHSGSRGIGNQIATAYVRMAQEMCTDKLESKEFAYFTIYQKEYHDYLKNMIWCQEYAFWQRESMFNALVRAVSEVVSEPFILQKVNCHHNYAEPLIDEGMWLTRKGAIDASEGKLGVIPGSMGAATYIVMGKGNVESYNTSPHGAGRLLGRNVAKKQLSVDEFKKQMEGKTWLDRDAQSLLDEAPFAYKPIETVIKDSEDLIEPVTILSQFINYKGL